MLTFLYRRGNGNDGNYARGLVSLSDDQSPFVALKFLVANDYIPRSGTRRHILRNIETEGEPDYGILATVYGDKDGCRAFDAAWLTAELQPLTEKDIEYYGNQNMKVRTLRDSLDAAAWRGFREENS